MRASRPLRQYLSARGPLSDDAPLFSSCSDRNHGEPLTTRSISRIIKEALPASGEWMIAGSRPTVSGIQRSRSASREEPPSSRLRLGETLGSQDYAGPTSYNLARVEAGAERCINF